MNIDATRYHFDATHEIFVTNINYGKHLSTLFTSVRILELIEPLHTELWGTSNKKKSLFQMLKTTRTIGGYLHLYHFSVFTISCTCY